MKVSVVICTYAMERYDVFSECVESVLAQTYEPLEVVIVVDGNRAVYDRVRSDWGDLADDESVKDDGLVGDGDGLVGDGDGPDGETNERSDAADDGGRSDTAGDDGRSDAADDGGRSDTPGDDGRSDAADGLSVVFHCNEENQGISYSRTKGAKIASGEVVAFIDDDAVAEPDWITELARVYEDTDAIAVGGHVAPDWVTEKPDFFPAEFYWLVGCDERGFGDHMEELRNTYGSNISYRRDVFLSVGGYDENTGRKGDRHIQAHEAPVCIRMAAKYGQGVIYNTDAVVHHKLFDYRGDFRWLVARSFWQGYSKRIMDLLLPEAKGDKNEYLKQLLLGFVPMRLKALVRRPSVAKVKQLVTIFVFTAAVGLGYLYGIVSVDESSLTESA